MFEDHNETDPVRTLSTYKVGCKYCEGEGIEYHSKDVWMEGLNASGYVAQDWETDCEECDGDGFFITQNLSEYRLHGIKGSLEVVS